MGSEHLLINACKMIQNRRHFIATMAMAGASIQLSPSIKTIFQSVNKFPIHLFSKPLDAYDTDFMCECISGAGIDGIDVTVRAGGKVEPVSVEKALPDFIEKASHHGLVTDMMTTGILSADDPFTGIILKTASSSGIKHYRMGWMEYDLKSGVLESLQKHKSGLNELTLMNRKFNINGGYQNHSGKMIGSAVWDLNLLLQSLPVEFTGIQYDVRHAIVEGAESWIIGLHLVADHISSLAIKDFTWKSIEGRMQPVSVPLGEGMVDWDTFFRTIKEKAISSPLTMHVEYPLLTGNEEGLTLSKKQPVIVKKLKKDADFLKSYLNKYQLS